MLSRAHHLFRQRITLEALTSTSASGANSYGAETSILGRICVSEEMVTDTNGRRLICTTRLYTDAAVKEGDRITYAGTRRIAGKVVERLNRYGQIDHLEVYLR